MDGPGTQPRAHVVLWGYPPTAADLEVTRFPTRKRIARALKPLVLISAIGAFLLVATLGTDIVITPLVFATALIFAYRAWRGDCEVRRFEGCCPRCSARLPLDTGANIHMPYTFDCYNCHARPVLMDRPHPGARRCGPPPVAD